jgi:hypothetical protein
MQVTLYQPPGSTADEGVYMAAAVHDVLSLVTTPVPMNIIETWSELERAIAYDWAMRHYLRSQGRQVRLRQCPTFVKQAPRRSAKDIAGHPGIPNTDAGLKRILDAELAAPYTEVYPYGY